MWGNDIGARIPVHTKSQHARNHLAGKIGHDDDSSNNQNGGVQMINHHSLPHQPHVTPGKRMGPATMALMSPSSGGNSHQPHQQPQHSSPSKIFINYGEETPPDYRQGTLSNMGIAGFLNSDVVPVYSTKKTRPHPHSHHSEPKKNQPYFHPPSQEQFLKEEEVKQMIKQQLPPMATANTVEYKNINDDDKNEDDDPNLYLQQSPSHPLISPTRTGARNEYMKGEGVANALHLSTPQQQQQQQPTAIPSSTTPDRLYSNIPNKYNNTTTSMDDEMSHLNRIPELKRRNLLTAMNNNDNIEENANSNNMLLPFQQHQQPKLQKAASSPTFVTSPEKKIGGAARHYQNKTDKIGTSSSSTDHGFFNGFSSPNNNNQRRQQQDQYQQHNHHHHQYQPPPQQTSTTPSKFASRFPISSSGSSLSGNEERAFSELVKQVWDNHNEATQSYLNFNPKQPFDLSSLTFASSFYDKQQFNVVENSGNTTNGHQMQQNNNNNNDIVGLNESRQNSPRNM